MEKEIPCTEIVYKKIANLLELVCERLDLPFKTNLINLTNTLVQYPRYIPERIFADIELKFKSLAFDLDFAPNQDKINLEKMVMNNYIFGEEDYELKLDSYLTLSGSNYTKEDSLIYKLLKGEMGVRVNVLHPMFLSDQHLVAEYREVKMGPKALSKSLNSKNGVDKKRISPVYTLNTGHTYFFYDKNKFLEKRLAQLVEEMKLRGISHNFINLIDDDYDYHKDTFNPEWWNDWTPDEAALNINMERIIQRFSIKTDGWYRFWKRPVLDMNDIISSRASNSFYECPKCFAIHSIETIASGENVCWNCCAKLPDNLELKTYY